MKFLGEKDYKYLEEVFIEDLIKDTPHIYESINFSDLINTKINYKDYIPVGSIPFIRYFYKKYYNINELYPIEIPECLRTDKFLKRIYAIMPGYKLPTQGEFFIKDCSTQKSFKYIGDMADLPFIDKSRLFVMSEIVNIYSEWRAYIINGEIQEITRYNGNPIIFPDVSIIQEANDIFSKEPNYPKSLTLDVMVTDKGTALVEIHPFGYSGLYTHLWGPELFNAFKQGKDYVLNHNTLPQRTI